MKKTWKLVALSLLFLTVFAPGRVASADDGEYDGQIILGQSFTLKSGETLQGDLAIVGGAVTIEQGAGVQGNIALIGGALQVDGEVNGNIAIIGGIANLGKTAYVSGDIAVIGGSLQRAEGAHVAGRVMGTLMSGLGGNDPIAMPPASPALPPPASIPSRPWHLPPFLTHLPRLSLDLWRGIPEAFFQSVGLALLAMLLMLFLAQPAERVSRTILSQPILTGGIGLLTVFVAPLLLLIMLMTILLIPVIPLVILALVTALLFGWMALGYEIGQRLVRAFQGSWHPSFAAGLGTFLLTICTFALLNIPGLNCIGWIIPTLLACAALGSVMVTSFGALTLLPRNHLCRRQQNFQPL